MKLGLLTTIRKGNYDGKDRSETHLTSKENYNSINPSRMGKVFRAMKYKIGDKVRVRDDLVVDEDYGSQTFVDDMQKYKGKIFTIESFKSNSYRLDGKDGWFWSEEMLEPVDEEVDKDIYDFITKKLDSSETISILGIAKEFTEAKWRIYGDMNEKYCLDKTIKLCEALKAYPNIKPKQEQLYYIEIINPDNVYHCGSMIYLAQYPDGSLSVNELEEDYNSAKIKFTRKEVEEISKKEGKDYTPFMVKVEE